MKRILLTLFLVSTLTGCNTLRKIAPLQIVQEVFNATLPKTFRGPVFMTRKNSIYDVILDGGDVHYNLKTSQWEFSWLVFTDNYHVATWSSGGKIVFGNPPVTPGR